VCAVMSWREREARNEARFRDQNEWIEAASESFGAAPLASEHCGPAPLMTFVCECGDGNCTQTIELTKSEYESVRSIANRFAIVLNHENSEVEAVVSECSRFAVVDKIESCALSVALETDPRSSRAHQGARPLRNMKELGGSPGTDLADRRSQDRDGVRLHGEVRRRARDRSRMLRLRLHLSATPGDVPFARAAITRLCEHLEIDDELTERIRLAVTEACSNCVLHAYGGRSDTAMYVLDARVDQKALRVSVCDSGVGVHNSPPSKHDNPGLGLGLIEKLADTSHVSSRPSGGTRVVMRFAMRTSQA
jgi:anti-sigma regulatory factor (Ser/Thr protein kinase)